MINITTNKLIDIYNAKFDEWNKEFKVPKNSADELLMDIVKGYIHIPIERVEEVKNWLQKFINCWEKIIVKEDEEYIQSIARVHMDYIHSTLQECLNGNVDMIMIEYSLQLVEKYRDKRED